MHSSLSQFTGKKDTRGNPILKPLPMPDWRLFWSRITTNVQIRPDPDALKKVKQGIAEEQRLFSAMENHTWLQAQVEHARRRETFLSKVLAGNALTLDEDFTDTQTSIYAGFRAKLAAMQEALERRISITRPDAKLLLESIADPLFVACEQIEETETAGHESWGTPFEPSDALKVLASAAQSIQHGALALASCPPGNPTRSCIIGFLPPGLIS